MGHLTSKIRREAVGERTERVCAWERQKERGRSLEKIMRMSRFKIENRQRGKKVDERMEKWNWERKKKWEKKFKCIEREKKFWTRWKEKQKIESGRSLFFFLLNFFLIETTWKTAFLSNSVCQYKIFLRCPYKWHELYSLETVFATTGLYWYGLCVEIEDATSFFRWAIPSLLFFIFVFSF